MKNKRIMALLLAVSLVLALAACGAGSRRDSMDAQAFSDSGAPMDHRDGMNQTDTMQDTESMAQNDGMQTFPAFEGMDLEGNSVKSEDLFGGNAATVVNFWFTTCGPCVGELSELDALNKELADKGAALVGINAFTLGGDKDAISDAKDVLAQKGASYQNVYFDKDSEAGTFADDVYAFPTTYVVDRKGTIVGQAIVGALTEPKQMEMVRQLVDQALATDTGPMS